MLIGQQEWHLTCNICLCPTFPKTHFWNPSQRRVISVSANCLHLQLVFEVWFLFQDLPDLPTGVKVGLSPVLYDK